MQVLLIISKEKFKAAGFSTGSIMHSSVIVLQIVIYNKSLQLLARLKSTDFSVSQSLGPIDQISFSFFLFENHVLPPKTFFLNL